MTQILYKKVTVALLTLLMLGTGTALILGKSGWFFVDVEQIASSRTHDVNAFLFSPRAIIQQKIYAKFGEDPSFKIHTEGFIQDADHGSSLGELESSEIEVYEILKIQYQGDPVNGKSKIKSAMREVGREIPAFFLQIIDIGSVMNEKDELVQFKINYKWRVPIKKSWRRH